MIGHDHKSIKEERMKPLDPVKRIHRFSCMCCLNKERLTIARHGRNEHECAIQNSTVLTHR